MTFGGRLRRAVTACRALSLPGHLGKGRAMNRRVRRVLVLGPRGAGKSELIRSLQESESGEPGSAVPTVGLGVEAVSLGDFCLTCWDVGCQQKLEPLRRQLYLDFDAFIFVVDSSSEEQVEWARRELALALSEDAGPGPVCQLVVAANKQDLPSALNASEVAQRLGLGLGLDGGTTTGGRPWSVVETSATLGRDLGELLEELSVEEEEPSRSASGFSGEEEALALLGA